MNAVSFVISLCVPHWHQGKPYSKEIKSGWMNGLVGNHEWSKLQTEDVMKEWNTIRMRKEKTMMHEKRKTSFEELQEVKTEMIMTKQE